MRTSEHPKELCSEVSKIVACRGLPVWIARECSPPSLWLTVKAKPSHRRPDFLSPKMDAHQGSLMSQGICREEGPPLEFFDSDNSNSR